MNQVATITIRAGWTDAARIDHFQEVTGANVGTARAYLVAEEGDVFDAIKSFRADAANDAGLLARAFTCSESFEALLNAAGNYRPSLHTSERNKGAEAVHLRRLADLYDEAQAARGDARRAYRY